MKTPLLIFSLMIGPAVAQIKPPSDVNALISGKTVPPSAASPAPAASTAPGTLPSKPIQASTAAPAAAAAKNTSMDKPIAQPNATVTTGVIPKAMEEVPSKVIFTVNPFTGTSKEYEDLQRRLAMSRIATQLADDISRRETILERSALIAPAAQLDLVRLSRERTQALRQGVEMIPPDRSIPDPITKTTNRTAKSKEVTKEQVPVAIATPPPPAPRLPRLVGLITENNLEPVALVEFAGATHSMKAGDTRPGIRLGKITGTSAEINGLTMMVDLSPAVAIDRFSTQQSSATVTRTVAPSTSPPLLPGSPLSATPSRTVNESAIHQQISQPLPR
jgi:hypothetical protein